MEDVKIKQWLEDNSGDGSGYGSGSGDGYGSGYGSGSGDGYGFGDGSGDGSGYGHGISQFNGKTVFEIDGVDTMVERVKGACAKGFILNEDFTLTPCYVVKGHGCFAHGKSLREAQQALHEKIFKGMDAEEAVEEFMKRFKRNETYKGTEFFEWHHYLTGSCLMGRESFVKNKGLDLEDDFTVEEFIEICENDYGSDIIRQLKERWDTLSEKEQHGLG